MTLLTYYKRGHTPAVEQLPDVRVIEWREPPGVGRVERLNSLLKPAYVPFYVRARAWIREALNRGERFDIAHQPTPVAMRYPSPVRGLGVPFLVGPVGGSLPNPPGFAGDAGRVPWYAQLRRLDALRMRHDTLLRRTYEEADVVLGIASYVLDALGDIPVRRFEVMSETAVESLPDRIPVSTPDRGPVQLLYVGRLVRTKGLRDLIRALGLLPDLRVTLDVVGDGDEQGPCRQLAMDLGVADRIRFLGRLPRQHVDDHYTASDVFVFPSYREPGGNVVFEAMSYGLPLIVTTRGGPGAATDDTCAIRIEPTSPAEFAQRIADAVRTLSSDPQRRAAMGAAARRRVADVGLWDAKIEHANRLYAEVLQHI